MSAAAKIADKGIHNLDCPVTRLEAEHVPFPVSPPLEDYVLPQVDDSVQEVRVRVD